MTVYGSTRTLSLVGTIFVAAGVILLAIGGWVGNRQYSILKTWPTVEATVTRSRVARTFHRGHFSYRAEMSFKYTIEGKTFEAPAGSSYNTSSYETMKAKADEYARGTQHPLKYNPADPNDIRMDAGYNVGFFLVSIILGALGLFFAGLGTTFLFASRVAKPLLCPSCGQAVEFGQRFCPNCAAPLTGSYSGQTPPGSYAA